MKFQSTVQLGLDFLSPESLDEAVRLAEEIRSFPNDHDAKLQMLEVRRRKFPLEVLSAFFILFFFGVKLHSFLFFLLMILLPLYPLFFPSISPASVAFTGLLIAMNLLSLYGF